MVITGELYLMKIPSNLTEQETVKKIHSVIDKIAPRYVFSGYDIDDIKQESFIICMDALSRYDEKRPLENFLSVHLSNRLKNFIRDNFANSQDERKKKIISPLPITNDNIAQENCETTEDIIFIDEVKDIIDSNLPSDMRPDYLRMLHGIYISKKRKEEITTFIKEMFNEKG
jgi:hypothetical protein